MRAGNQSCKPTCFSRGYLTEYIALAFKNWHGTEEALQRSIEYHRRRDKDDEIKLT